MLSDMLNKPSQFTALAQKHGVIAVTFPGMVAQKVRCYTDV